MLAQFSIWPLDSPRFSEDIATATKILDQLNVRYKLGAVSTTVEGEWHDVMNAIQACHEALRQNHARVVTNVTIDDDGTRTQTIAAANSEVTAPRSEQG